MATALVKELVDHAQGRFGEWRPRLPDRKVGEFLPQTEPLNQGTNSDAWATVVFQVFWWPHDLPDMNDMGKQRVVLLGEAVCPPMSSLGASFRAHRLPLHQWQRSPPIDVAPFESLSGHLEQYVDSLRRKFDEKHRDAKVRRLSEMKRQDDLHALERDLMLAFPSFSGLEPHCQPQSPKAVELGTPVANRPVPIAVPENPLVKDLPAVYRGPCCLDVDLAFVGPSDPRRATVVGHDGTLAFEVRSLRVPPFDHGYVSLRVVEAARLDQPKVTSERTSNRPEIAGTTENGAVLEWKMLQNRALEAARLSRTRALWSSGSVLLGSWAGSILTPCCTAMWTTRKASASVWISSQQEILRAAQQDTLPETAREQMNFRKAGPFVIPVTNKWVPMSFESGEPLPRCRELFYDTAHFGRDISPCKARGRR